MWDTKVVGKREKKKCWENEKQISKFYPLNLLFEFLVLDSPSLSPSLSHLFNLLFYYTNNHQTKLFLWNQQQQHIDGNFDVNCKSLNSTRFFACSEIRDGEKLTSRWVVEIQNCVLNSWNLSFSFFPTVIAAVAHVWLVSRLVNCKTKPSVSKKFCWRKFS